MINKTQLIGFEAFSKSLENLFPDGGEIHLKVSHNIFFKGYTDNGNLTQLYSTKGNGVDRITDNKINNPYEYLRKLSETKNGGVFFIPSKPKGAPVKECVQHSDLLSCEMDGGSTDEQWEQLENFVAITGLTFATIIGSGGKSLHGHIKLISPVGIDTRTHWQRLLSIAMLSDPAVNHPHQPMRIPGFFRLEKGKEQTLESYSDVQHSFDEFWEGFRKIFDVEGYQFFTTFTQERWAKIQKILCNPADAKKGEIKLTPSEQKAEIKRILSLTEDEINPPRKIYNNDNFSYSGDTIPLEFFLPKAFQEDIQSGWSKGSGRNPRALNITQRLVGTEETLNRLGINFSGDSYQLVSNFGARCTPPIPIDSVYKNGKKMPFDVTEDEIKRSLSYWEYTHNPDRFSDRISKTNQSNQSNSNQQTPNDDWKKQKAHQAKLAWKNNKKYTPDITYSEQHCTSPMAPNRGEIVCLKYGTSQGKSTWIKLLFEKGDLKDFGAIKLGSRNSLEYQFARSSGFIHLKDDGQIHIIDPKGRTTSCIDSILKYDDDDFDGKVLILDEIESVARHLLYAGTLKERQQQIIDKYEIATQRCHSIILADGNLSDNVCNFIQKISGKKLIKYYNDVIPLRPNVIFYDDIERKSSEKLSHQIKGEVFPWVMFDSQVDCEAMDKDLTKYGRKVLRIDSKTINDPILGKIIKRFLENPDLFLSENEITKTYDVILSTPTVESGLDCNYKGFSGVYLLCKHLEINTLLQMIIRVRDINCPRHVCAPKFVKPSDDSVIKSPLIKTLHQLGNDLQKQSIEALGSELGLHRDDILKALQDSLAEAFNSPEQGLFDVFNCIKNYEHSNYRECFIESLEQSGYNVTFAQIGKPIMTQFKECKTEVKQKKADDISNAEPIDKQQFESLSKRQDLDWDDRCSVYQFRFLERLPGVDSVGGLTSDLIYHLLYENKKLISQSEIRWMMSNPELAVKRSKKAWHGVLKFNRTFLGNFKTLLPLVKELNRLDVPKLMDKLTTIYYNSDYPEVKSLWESWGRVQVTRTGIERGNNPTMLIKRIAAKLGYETVESGSVWNGKSSRMNYILNDLLTTSQYGIIVKSCVNTRLESENLDPAIGDNDWLEVIHPESLQPLHSIQSSPLKRAGNTIDIKDTVLEDLAPYQTPDTEPENLDFDKLQPGEILFDDQSQPHQVTVQDVVVLIKQSIQNQNGKQAMWIDKTYGQGKNSLMEQAMSFDDDCCGIYDVMDLVG